MSQANIIPLQTIQVRDKRLGWDETGQTPFGVKVGGTTNALQVFSTASASNDNITWTVNPPSAGVGIGRNVLMRVGFSCVFNGITNTSGENFFTQNSGAIAPRARPLAQCTSVINCTMNGNVMNQPNFQIVSPFLHVGRDNYSRNTNTSMCPDMPDFFANSYDDGYDYLGTGTGAGIVVDPLSAAGNSVAQLTPRGAWAMTDANPGSTTCTLQFYTTESLMLSPFLDDSSEEAFIGVQNMIINLTLRNLNRCLSVNDTLLARLGKTYTSITTSIIASPQVLFNYITPSPIMKIPKAISYNYNSLTVYTTGTFSVAASASTTQTSNNIQFGIIPKRLIVFVREQDADLDETKPDGFGAITNAVITFDNRQIMAASTSETLYQTSHRNGLNMSYPQFSKYTGSVLVFDVVNDLCVQPAESASLATSKQFNIQLTWTNQTARTIVYSMYIIQVNEGLATITENSLYLQNSVLTPEDVISAATSDFVSPNDMTDDTLYGAGFLKKLKNAAKSVAKFAKKTGVVSNVLGAVNPQAAALAQQAGYGFVGGVGGSYEPYLGGASMPKKMLRLKN
jgi:hypothetical protein